MLLSIPSSLFPLAFLAFSTAPHVQGTWAPTSPMPEPRRWAAVASCGAQIYLIGGETPSEPRSSDVLAYHSATETWVALPDYPGPPIRSASAIELGGSVYLFGGYLYDYAISDQVWRLDPATGFWESRTPMPEARLLASLHELNGRIYLLGGRTAPVWTYRNTGYAYDPGLDGASTSADPWTELSNQPLLTSGLGDNNGATIEGDLFTLGSYEPHVPSRFVVYSPRSQRWRELPPGPFTTTPAAIRVGRTLFALQGDGLMWSWEYTPAAGTFSKIQSIDGGPDLGSFVPRSTRPAIMWGAAVAEHDGCIYSFGGWDSSLVASGWVFTP